MTLREILKPTILKGIITLIAFVISFTIMSGCFGGSSTICKIFINDWMFWTFLIWFPLIVYIITSIIIHLIKKEN